MILSHKHQFVFLKTNKTGGTSLEIALSRYCGPEDVITPISAEDERTRAQLGYPGPQNHRVPLSDYRARHWRLALKKGKRLKYYNHMSAAEVQVLAGEDVWQNYFTFCFERNPWERVLSLYYWRHPSPPRPSLDEFVASGVLSKLKEKGSALYTRNDRILVDQVCRYEAFAEEAEQLARRLNLPGPLEAPRAKGGLRAKQRDRQPGLSAESRRIIRAAFSFELARYDYPLDADQHEALTPD